MHSLIQSLKIAQLLLDYPKKESMPQKYKKYSKIFYLYISGIDNNTTIAHTVLSVFFVIYLYKNTHSNDKKIRKYSTCTGIFKGNSF